MDYEQLRQDAKKKFLELAAQRTIIDREMQACLRIMEGAEMGAEPPEPVAAPTPVSLPDPPAGTEAEALGVTKAVRLVLERSRGALLPTEIRDGLESLGIESRSPKVLLIHVHNVLRRLLENDEVEPVPRDGKMAYRLLSYGDRLVGIFREHPLVSILSAIPTAREAAQIKGMSHEVKNAPPTASEE